MSETCKICKNKTLFYVWSTGYGFPRREAVEVYCETWNKTHDHEKKEAWRSFCVGEPICFWCMSEFLNVK